MCYAYLSPQTLRHSFAPQEMFPSSWGENHVLAVFLSETILSQFPGISLGQGRAALHLCAPPVQTSALLTCGALTEPAFQRG